MLHLDSNKRISAEEALKHPYFHSEPLPCHPSDFPSFSGDFHEFTVRQDRRSTQNNIAAKNKKKQSSQAKPSNLDGGKHFATPRRQQQPSISANISKSTTTNIVQPSQTNNSLAERAAKLKSQSESQNLQMGAKKPSLPPSFSAVDSKCKLSNEPAANNLLTKPTPGLISKTNGCESLLAKKENDAKGITNLDDFISFIQTINCIKKRDRKDEYKNKGRGKHE